MKELINSFKNSAVGDLVRVNDVDLIVELSEGEATKSKNPDFLIKEKKSYLQDGAGFETLLLDHIGSDLEYLLVCSYFGEDADAKLYVKPDFFNPDRRNVLVTSETGWLFDGESYPQEIYSGDITYIKKFQNESFGDNCIVEWVTESKIINYQLLVIETRTTNPFGGWVEFYEGRQIQLKDVVF